MPTTNLSVAKKIILGVAIFWTFLIAFLCLVQFNDLPSFGVSGMDKYVHFTFHFVFTFLWSVYFCSLLKDITFKTVFNVFFVSVSYGILIEFLQGTCTSTRKADIMDVLANATGSLIAIIAILLYKYFRQKKLLTNK